MTKLEELAGVAHTEVARIVSFVAAGPRDGKVIVSPTEVGCQEVVRAVLKALREPGEAAVLRGAEAIGGAGAAGNRQDATQAWQAMIDFILRD